MARSRLGFVFVFCNTQSFVLLTVTIHVVTAWVLSSQRSLFGFHQIFSMSNFRNHMIPLDRLRTTRVVLLSVSILWLCHNVFNPVIKAFAFPNFALISLVDWPSRVSSDLRYVKTSTCSTGVPSIFMLQVLSCVAMTFVLSMLITSPNVLLEWMNLYLLSTWTTTCTKYTVSRTASLREWH